ncbi:MAG: 2-hydroxyacid dehydrogenase [Chitinophagales bacterium]|jgi:D-3-phosphoglycerate dehydrogenase|nr:MAG: 2-hydroxyacid dehydrogenase [Chitinophagales bacterium]
MKVLLTTTSFQDTPGKHQDLLYAQGFEIETMRGPLKAEELLPVIDKFDALLCGDDELNAQVLEKGKAGRLKYISKYGVGLDKIDLEAAKRLGIQVTNCPGVNSRAVAEHVMALMLCFYRHIHLEYNITKAGKWVRYVGHEVQGKTAGILGLGAIGKETAALLKAFGLNVKVYDIQIDKNFVETHNLVVADSLTDLLRGIDVLSLHLPLTPQTQNIINIELLKAANQAGLLLINTARAGLVSNETIIQALNEDILAGYCTDVLDEEPMPPNHPLKALDRVIITPHIGSRTFQSVERQGLMAVNNLLRMIQEGNA